MRTRTPLPLVILTLALIPGPGRAAEDAVETAALRHVFVTSATGTGDLSTWTDSGSLDDIAGANQVCHARAEAAGLATAGAPEFRAWISNSTTDAWCNVQGLTGRRFLVPACDGGVLTTVGPWVRTDGTLFADSLSQLVSGGPYVPVAFDESGAGVAGVLKHFTATGDTGSASSFHCTGWSTTTGNATVGSDLGTADWTTSSPTSPCATAARLLCLELGQGVPVAKPSAPGHLVFVSSTSGTGDLDSWADAGGQVGIAAGDAICQARAATARLPVPASFHVWLSDTANDAACRVRGQTGLVAGGCDGVTPALDAPYRRIDGFVLASSFADLTDALLSTSISVNELGNGVFANVWTGSTAAGTLAPNGTCSEWQDGTNGSTTEFGRSDRTDGKWSLNGSTICSATSRIFCVGAAVADFWDDFESGSFARWTATSP